MIYNLINAYSIIEFNITYFCIYIHINIYNYNYVFTFYNLNRSKRKKKNVGKRFKEFC